MQKNALCHREGFQDVCVIPYTLGIQGHQGFSRCSIVSIYTKTLKTR